MTERSNIDDILESIDALLKEDEAQEGHDGSLQEVSESAQAESLPEGQAGVQEMGSNQSIRILPDIDEQSGVSGAQNIEAAIENGQETVQKTRQDMEKGQGKRLVLSADMQVENTPELPNMVNVEQAETVENGSSARADFVDDGLIAQITAEVCAGLSQRLPTMISPLVEAAIRRHLSASNESNQHAE